MTVYSSIEFDRRRILSCTVYPFRQENTKLLIGFLGKEEMHMWLTRKEAEWLLDTLRSELRHWEIYENLEVSDGEGRETEG